MPLTRRQLFLSLGIAATLHTEPGLSPHDEVATAANHFHKKYEDWAAAMNRNRQPGTICADCISEFWPMDDLWKSLRSAVRRWARGY